MFLIEENMAAAERSKDSRAHIPDYDYGDVNTIPFHIGSFGNEWLKRLKPSEYSYESEDEDTFNANFVKEMGVSAEVMAELKSTCR